MKRRTVMLAAVSGSASLILGQRLGAQETKPKPHPARVKQRNVKIRVSKFAFSPNHVTIPQGEKIVFELTSSDVMHGFSIPDLNTRIDVPPGQITLLPLTPLQAGDFIFVCDTLCGDGHEKMRGKLTVTAST